MKVKIPECENRFYSCFGMRHINLCVSGPTFFNESSFTSLCERKNQLALKALIQCCYWHLNHYFVQIVNKPKDYTQKSFENCLLLRYKV